MLAFPMADRVIFRQHDLTRAIKAATAGGLNIGRVEIDPTGKLSIISANEQQADAAEAAFDAFVRTNARKA